MIAGGLLLLAAGLGTFGVVKALERPVVRAATIVPSPGSDLISGIEKQNGPWGELEISDIQIDPPEDYAARLFVPTNHGVWFFGKGYDRPKILSLFAPPDLTTSQRTELSDPARWEISSQSIRVKPDSQTVFKLSSTARSRIYRALSEFRENFFQASPFMFPKGRSNDWFFHSGLSAGTTSLILGLFYESGTMLCFADVGILDHVSSDAEKKRLIMALSRTPSVLVNLRIASGADPEPLLQYWGRRDGRKKTWQLVNSLARGREGGSIDVTLLLPSFVRDHVYTYPEILADRTIVGPDCLWSALSVDNDLPGFAEATEADLISRLKERYELTDGPSQTGDVMVFSNSAGRIIHACVYVAGNIVFTKNGASVFAPWVLMRLPDVVGFYSDNTAPRILCFRMKPAKSGHH